MYFNIPGTGRMKSLCSTDFIWTTRKTHFHRVFHTNDIAAQTTKGFGFPISFSRTYFTSTWFSQEGWFNCIVITCNFWFITAHAHCHSNFLLQSTRYFQSLLDQRINKLIATRNLKWKMVTGFPTHSVIDERSIDARDIQKIANYCKWPSPAFSFTGKCPNLFVDDINSTLSGIVELDCWGFSSVMYICRSDRRFECIKK